MIKHETITVEGTVLYCDRCWARGPQAAYDDAAIEKGWSLDDNGNGKDLCPKCVAVKP